MLQKAADSRAGGATGSGGGLAKLTSWLGAKKPAAAALAADAPVILPPWDPAAATVSAEAEVQRISAALGSCGRPVAPGGETAPAAAAALPAGDDVAVTTERSADTGAAVGTAERTGEDNSGSSSAPVTAAKVAVAVGEDDDEEDEEDEEEDET